MEVSDRVSSSPCLFSFSCQFCRLFVSTVERCETAALERLEANAKLKRQNFGSQSYSPPKSSASLSAAATPQTAATLLQFSETAQEESDSTPKKGTRTETWLPVQHVSCACDAPSVYFPLIDITLQWLVVFNSCVIDRFFTPNVTNHLIREGNTS